ncbi:TadE/TadG family type IV pilus assembly protein [Tatumella citrea]|uniref:Uncharacterized protein n=1 Tax=Tatumella citrea TaxID=53336 RepID=A0A1Y0L5Z1_TATCI|nr:VWA domain-containing protein [Tatumella citrea]ARU93165.1 hypothetical protein A7K98_04755 [Tatumella citrea]ARU97204.1 hypothetical protein A7K99_04755 [Tatumella citrea]
MIVPLAILLPIVFGLMTLGINSVSMMANRARLADASSEATLAVSAATLANDTQSVSGRQEIERNRDMVVSWMKYYFPGMKSVPEVNFTVAEGQHLAGSDTRYTYYDVDISLTLPQLFTYQPVTSGKSDYKLKAGNGHVNKYVSKPADYVFVVDFSGSQAGGRIAILKSVFAEITDFVLTNSPESKIAIVPFSTGVSVVMPGTNQRGGQNMGCSVLFVPNSDWNINYAFWGDKKVSTSYARKPLKTQTYYMDSARYSFYKKYVAASLPTIKEAEMQNRWCRKNSAYGVNEGQMQYSCFDPRDKYPDPNDPRNKLEDIFSKESQGLIEQEYAKAAKIFSRQAVTFTIEHDESINYPATLEKMFGNEAIITFPLLWTPYDSADYRPWHYMCRQAGWWKHKAGNDLTKESALSWLIPLTNSKTELDQFQKMDPVGGTHLSSGLIRSVPVMMEGTNRRKVFIMMSDGDDSPYPKITTDKWLKTYNLCQKIEEGILARSETNASKVEIYYISTTNAYTWVDYWANNCTGPARSKTASKRDDLVKLIKGIITDETGHLAVD